MHRWRTQRTVAQGSPLRPGGDAIPAARKREEGGGKREERREKREERREKREEGREKRDETQAKS